MENNVKVFIDHVGHSIVGELLGEENKVLKIKNPAILIAAPNNNGQLTVQLVPVFFKEFIKQEKRENGAVFNYPVDKIVLSEVDLETRLLEQYVGMFTPTPKVENKETPTIKLFDE
jgi:hypothetical protein